VVEPKAEPEGHPTQTPVQGRRKVATDTSSFNVEMSVRVFTDDALLRMSIT
jgi:hypothetical protein